VQAASPCSTTKDGFVRSAELGWKLAHELAVEWDWATYAEEPRPEAFKPIARVTRAGGGTLNPDAGELQVTAG